MKRRMREAVLHTTMRLGCPLCTLDALHGPAAVFAAGFALGAKAAATGNAPSFCPKHDALVQAQLALVGLATERVRVEDDGKAVAPAHPMEGMPLPEGLTEEEAAFLRWWQGHSAEWHAIGQEMIARGLAPTADEITTEQYRRMNDRGESVFEARTRIDRILRGRGVVSPTAGSES